MSEIVRVHKKCLEAVEAPARSVLTAFEAFQQHMPSTLGDAETVSLTIKINLGTLRRLQEHLRGHGSHT